MVEKKEPLVVLGMQQRTLQDQPRKVSRKTFVRRKESEGFPLWYICAIVLVVAVLSYFLVPAVRERAAQRLAQLSGKPVPTTQAAVTPQSNTPASAERTGVSAPPATAPQSQGAAAEAYFAASMARQKPAAAGQGPKASTPSGQNEGGAQRSPAVSPDVAASQPDRLEVQPRVVSPPRTERGTPPVLVRRKAEPEPPEETKAPVAAEAPAGVDSVPAQSGARSEEAYKLLLEKVPAMAAISAQSDPAMQLKGWSVVKAEESEVWIDVLALRTADKQEEHFIWKIRVDEQTVFPLNQNARRLAVK